ncbi:MAG: hypothetical protein J6O13_11215 [Selenomonas sp.]|nr:hypothetical protein [Selenomonas sp.]
MATTTTTTATRGNFGEVVFDTTTVKKYYDDSKKTYEIFGAKPANLFFAREIRDLLPKIKNSDGYYIMKIMANINDCGEICRYDGHKNKLTPIRSQADFGDFLGLSKPATSQFLKRMDKLNLVRSARHLSASTHKIEKTFYFSPAIMLKSRKINVDYYAAFQDVIDERVKPWTRADLHDFLADDGPLAKCREDKKDEIAAIKDIVADSDVIDDVTAKEVDDLLAKMGVKLNKEEPLPNIFGEVDNARQLARAAKFNPFLTAVKADDIAKEYICGQEPHLYAMEDGGMRKAEYSDNKDIYFLPNTPSEYHDKKPKNSDIVNFNSWYIDIDAGKDENGHYFTTAEVEKRKELMRNVIDQLPAATYINSTRNGYHIYFSCDGVDSEEEWRKVENKLIEVIEIADKAVKDPARLMRLPASWWHKNDKSAATGCESYHCHPLVANRKKYSAAELLDELDRVAENVKKACDNYQLTFGDNINEGNGKVAAKVNVTVDDSARIADIRSLTVATFDIPAATTTVDNAKNWLRQQSLAEFLQIANPNSFACVFHDDEHPSATIYNNESGDRYVCAAASCSVSSHGYDIFDCVMNLANCDFATAMQYLTKVFNITDR